MLVAMLTHVKTVMCTCSYADMYVRTGMCACSYADTYVRTVALNSIRELSSDELLDYLPQLVQVSARGVRGGLVAERRNKFECVDE